MDIIDKIDKQKLLLAGLLIAIGVLGRIILHDFFNGIVNPWEQSGDLGLDVFFVIAAVSIFSGVLLGKFYALIVPIAVIVISDIFYAFVDPVNALIYSTYLFLFTITGYVFIALIGLYTKKKSKLNLTFIPKILGAGILGIIIYDLWTNFGFWLSFSRAFPEYIPPTLGGLATAYSGGIPMMIWHILSGGIVIVIVAAPLLYLKEHKILKTEFVLKPLEKYSIAGATATLMALSVISALI
ncbi:MAG: hypothetical protein BV456_07385 [Thermoplasmata archaeon M8B2D]|nr:MAG: hypothetical protein BV456_07385 [Thermoplasmata archaeon M8B2D]